MVIWYTFRWLNNCRAFFRSLTQNFAIKIHLKFVYLNHKWFHFCCGEILLKCSLFLFVCSALIKMDKTAKLKDMNVATEKKKFKSHSVSTFFTLYFHWVHKFYAPEWALASITGFRYMILHSTANSYTHMSINLFIYCYGSPKTRTKHAQICALADVLSVTSKSHLKHFE